MNDVLFSNTALVSVNDLNPYDKNPRKGDVRAIAESLATNKQYRPIVVQKNSKKILAGNHTWQAAKMLKWDKIAVVFVDVDDEQAARIVLADNRTNDLADYDHKILAELLEGLGDIAGTGYSEEDMNAILNAVQEASNDVFINSANIQEQSMLDNDQLVDLPIGPLAGGQNSGWDDEDSDIGIPDNNLSNEADDLSGVFTLKDDLKFPGKTYWEIPFLRSDMLIEELPDPLHTWAGSATRDLGWEGYWLYNWGVDSTSGMTDLSKILLSFYTWDEYFENWWHYPSRHMSKLVNAKIKYAITPNYSQGDLPRAVAMYNLYRSRWVGRYMQEIGVRVMPDLESREEPEMTEIFISSLPKPLPWASIQIQNFLSKSRTGNVADEAHIQKHFAHSRLIVERCEAQNLLVYAHPNTWDRIRDEFDSLDVNLRFMETRLFYLAKREKSKKDQADIL